MSNLSEKYFKLYDPPECVMLVLNDPEGGENDYNMEECDKNWESP